MEERLKAIYQFIQNVKNNSSVRVDEFDTDELDYYFSLENNLSKDRGFVVFEKRFLEDYKIPLNDSQKLIFYLSAKLTWTRGEEKSGEGVLSGGMFFNGLTDIFHFKPTFFERSLEKFLEYENESKTDIDLIHQLRFIESPTSLQDAFYTPYFGCVTLKENEFPTDFYFYDSGLVYKLPFTTYEEYIDALIQSSAVCCWQYFYINPQEIITKNKGIDYITWAKHTSTTLDKDLSNLVYVPNAKYDRLDMINEYLERCVRLLPDAFPFLNFEHHIQYYDELKKSIISMQ